MNRIPCEMPITTVGRGEEGGHTQWSQHTWRMRNTWFHLVTAEYLHLLYFCCSSLSFFLSIPIPSTNSNSNFFGWACKCTSAYMWMCAGVCEYAWGLLGTAHPWIEGQIHTAAVATVMRVPCTLNWTPLFAAEHSLLLVWVQKFYVKSFETSTVPIGKHGELFSLVCSTLKQND